RREAKVLRRRAGRPVLGPAQQSRVRGEPLTRSTMQAFSRRDCLRFAAAGFAGCSLSGWLGRLAAEQGKDPARKRSCILLWMNGGPSQLDTFDLKPGHANGGPFKEISTNVPGIKIRMHE